MSDERAMLEQKLARLHDVLRRLFEYQGQEDSVWDKYQHRYLPYRESSSIAWVIGLSAGFIIVLSTLMAMMMSVPILSIDVVFWPIVFSLIGVFVTLMVLFARGQANKVKMANMGIQEQNNLIREQIAIEGSAELIPIEKELARARLDYQEGEFAGWFPEKYMNLTDVYYCWELVRDHRADTVQGVINAYELKLHHQRLENMAAAQLAEQQRMSEQARLNGILNAVGQAAILGTMHSQGRAASAQSRATANQLDGIHETLKKPVRIVRG